MNTTTNSQSFNMGDYLTDQRRLYRLLQFVPARLGRRAAILEDCSTLETIVIRPGQLRRMRLQLVRRPADGLAGSPTAGRLPAHLRQISAAPRRNNTPRWRVSPCQSCLGPGWDWMTPAATPATAASCTMVRTCCALRTVLAGDDSE